MDRQTITLTRGAYDRALKAVEDADRHLKRGIVIWSILALGNAIQFAIILRLAGWL